MRIALLNQYYAPSEAATAQLLSDLGEHLVGAGHRVTAICSRRAYDDPSRIYPPRETIAGVEVRRTWTTGFGRASGAGRLLDYVSFLAGAGAMLALGPRFDVVVSLTTPPMLPLLGVLAGRLRGSRSLTWVMDVYPDVAVELGVLRRGSAASRVLSRLATYTLRRSDTVLALDEAMAEHLAAAGGRSVEVIHNWADGEAIRPAPVEGHAVREAWGWQGRFVVLYSGNIGLAHEFETVLDAAGLLGDRPEILFAFVGSGPRRAEVERQVALRGLTNVEFKPLQPRERLGQSLTAGDAHLVTLRTGLPGLLVPSKIYGILAAGRPALYVGPDRGEIASIVRDGGCGAAFDLGDARGLADGILRYAADAGLRHEQGRRARALFEARYTRQAALGALRELIEATGRASV